MFVQKQFCLQTHVECFFKRRKSGLWLRHREHSIRHAQPSTVHLISILSFPEHLNKLSPKAYIYLSKIYQMIESRDQQCASKGDLLLIVHELFTWNIWSNFSCMMNCLMSLGIFPNVNSVCITDGDGVCVCIKKIFPERFKFRYNVKSAETN